MKRSISQFLGTVESFFRQYLQTVRGASPHTVRAYRDTLRLFLEFLSRRCRHPIDRLNGDHITCEHVSEFLAHLETGRKNSPRTRNGRLAALRCFVRHLLQQDPTRAGEYSRILALPGKRTIQSPPGYLEPEQFRAFLNHVDLRKPFGVRDAALFLLLYNTGARISEALQLRWSDLRLEPPWQVRLQGKGSKDRLCPLWKQTVNLLRQLRCQANFTAESVVFLNRRGEPLSRDGAAHLLRVHFQRARQASRSLPKIRIHPHLLRHSCAVALLQAGVELTGIRDYLGHSSVSTTSRYLQTNLAMKEKVLKRFWQRAGLQENSRASWRPSRGVLHFLQSL